MRHLCNLAATESGLECTCMNSDFTVPVNGGGRCHWMSMCTVWLSHSKRLSRATSVAQTLQWWSRICWEIHVPQGSQQAEPLRMLNMHRLQSTKTGSWRWELGADLGLPKTAVSEILEQDLGMKRVVAKFVPQLLLPEQKEPQLIMTWFKPLPKNQISSRRS